MKPVTKDEVFAALSSMKPLRLRVWMVSSLSSSKLIGM
jgi:hypothetical protein